MDPGERLKSTEQRLYQSSLAGSETFEPRPREAPVEPLSASTAELDLLVGWLGPEALRRASLEDVPTIRQSTYWSLFHPDAFAHGRRIDAALKPLKFDFDMAGYFDVAGYFGPCNRVQRSAPCRDR